MTREFKWETVYEDDCSWDVLFVRIDQGRWLVAQPNFGTEDINEIIKILENDPKIFNN